MPIQSWKFADTIDSDRRDRLNEAPAFAEIIETVRGGMNILCAHIDPSKDNPPFSRAVFSIRVSDQLFDWVFNSVNGFRAWFFRSPYDGLRQNARMIGELAPVLLESMKSTTERHLARDSLNSLSAKVWLAECGNEVCQDCAGCKGEWEPPKDDKPEILNGRWNLSREANAKYGQKAPRFTKLRVYGGFLNEQRDEWIPMRKRHRAQQIRDLGWS